MHASAVGSLAGHDSVKGFRLVAADGAAGRIAWASYAPNESYLVVTSGLLRRTHRVVPAAAVTAVHDGEVHVALSKAEVRALPALPHPEAALTEETTRMLNAFERAASIPQSGGF